MQKKKYLGSRIILSIVIITTSLLVSFSIANSSSKSTSLDPIKNNKKETDPSLQFVIENNKNSNVNNGLETLSKEENLTDGMADIYLSALAQKNPNGLRGVGESETVNVPGIKNIEGSLDNYVSNYAPKALDIKEVTKKDLVVLEDASRDDNRKYYKKIINISEKNFNEFSKTEAKILKEWLSSQGTSSEINNYKNAIENQVNDLLSVEVPKSWVDIHIKAINILKAKRVAYSAMIDVSDDPLKALAGFKISVELAHETVELKKSFDKMAQSLGIK